MNSYIERFIDNLKQIRDCMPSELLDALIKEKDDLYSCLKDANSIRVDTQKHNRRINDVKLKTELVHIIKMLECGGVLQQIIDKFLSGGYESSFSKEKKFYVDEGDCFRAVSFNDIKDKSSATLDNKVNLVKIFQLYSKNMGRQFDQITTISLVEDGVYIFILMLSTYLNEINLIIDILEGKIVEEAIIPEILYCFLCLFDFTIEQIIFLFGYILNRNKKNLDVNPPMNDLDYITISELAIFYNEDGSLNTDKSLEEFKNIMLRLLGYRISFNSNFESFMKILKVVAPQIYEDNSKISAVSFASIPKYTVRDFTSVFKRIKYSKSVLGNFLGNLGLNLFSIDNYIVAEQELREFIQKLEDKITIESMNVDGVTLSEDAGNQFKGEVLGVIHPDSNAEVTGVRDEFSQELPAIEVPNLFDLSVYYRDGMFIKLPDDLDEFYEGLAESSISAEEKIKIKKLLEIKKTKKTYSTL